MISDNRLAGAFKFPNKPDFSRSSLYDLVGIFINFGYSVSIEPKDDHILIDIFENEQFQNRPLPFEEDT